MNPNYYTTKLLCWLQKCWGGCYSEWSFFLRPYPILLLPFLSSQLCRCIHVITIQFLDHTDDCMVFSKIFHFITTSFSYHARGILPYAWWSSPHKVASLCLPIPGLHHYLLLEFISGNNIWNKIVASQLGDVILVVL